MTSPRGGRREGAGRKPTGVETASFSLRRDQIERLEAEEIRRSGESKSAIVRAALDAYFKRVMRQSRHG